MTTDLIVYILLCLVAAGFVRRVGAVFSAYEAPVREGERLNQAG